MTPEGREAVDPIIETLRSARRRLGLSQTDVAQMVGRKTYQTLHQWERGINSPTLANVRAWAAALGYDLTAPPFAAAAQREYDAAHDSGDHHCLNDPCAWHPHEQRIRPLPTFPPRLVLPARRES